MGLRSFNNWFTRAILGSVLIVTLAAGDALAQRGDRGGGGRGGGGGGDRGGGRSFSGGGGGGGRSFSGGGGGGGRSSSRGGGGGGQSFRSGGEGRSFSGGDRGSSTRSFSRPSGGSPSFRSGPSTRGPSIGQRSMSERSGRSFSGRSLEGGPSRSFRDGISSRGPSLDSSQQGRARTFRGGSDLRAGDRGREFRGDYRTARPSDDQLRRFLGDDRGPRQDITRRRGDELTRRGGDERGRDLSRQLGDRDRVARSRIGDLDRRDRDRDRGGLGGRDGIVDRGDRDQVADRLGDRDRDGRDRDRDRRDFFDRDRDRGDLARGDRDRDWRRGDRGRDWDRGDRDWDRRRHRDQWDWTARHVRDHYRDRWHGRRWSNWNAFPFYAGWWGYNNYRGWGPWGYYARRYNDPWYWWGWSTAPVLTNWVTYNWGRPYYWDYGPGEYIYCDNNVVYVNGQWYAPAPEYYERTLALAQSAPELTQEEAQQIEWMPLGVFAVTPEGADEFDLMVQLAVTKDGIIGGTVFNETNNKNYSVEGTVDRETQRAVWSYVDDNGKRIQMETSIYNLTKPETTALVHYSPEKIEVRQLVRLEAPEGGAEGGVGQPTTVAKPAAGELPPPAPAQ